MSAAQPATVDAEVLIIGAGILGVNALYELTQAGFSVHVLEQGGGAGGAWYWNRYPNARFDSESYTYAYLFSKELFDEWRWSEHFAAQPEIERYINYVIDKFDLRRHITFDSQVDSARWDEDSATWMVTTAGGETIVVRQLIATTGVLSVPYIPDVEGKDTFRGRMHHTGLWPDEPIDFTGKRVAVIGTGSSGVQVIPTIAPIVDSLTVYQRGANWCTPLNNRPITDAEQAELRADFESLRDTVRNSSSGFLHEPSGRKHTDDTVEERESFFEKMWKTPGFGKLVSNYENFMLDPEINALWSDFVERKIRARVDDQRVADILIPKDHRFGGKRPPMETDYYETYNRPNVSLVDLHEHPMVRITETGIQTSDDHREFDIIVWATGFDFGTGALNRIDIRGRDGQTLAERWKDGPVTFAGTMARGFPNFFFPGGPHGSASNNPRYGEDQIHYVCELLIHLRDRNFETIEVTQDIEDEWMKMCENMTPYISFTAKSFYFGGNIPGKPSRMLQNPGGRPKMMEFYAQSIENEYQGFEFRP